MVKSLETDSQSGPDGFPIRTVASLTGVKPVTLRAWERRYGLLKPRRTNKGHRLYSRDDVDRITRLQALLEQGIPVGQAAAMVSAQNEQDAVAQLDTWTRSRKRCRRAIARFDEVELAAIVNEVQAIFPVSTVTRELLVPLRDALAKELAEGIAAAAEQGFYLAWLRIQLGARLHHRNRPSRAATLVIAPMPGEIDDSASLLFALAAATDYQVVPLGPGISLQDLEIPVQRMDANGLVLLGSAGVPPGVLEHALPALTRRAGIPVFVGGLIAVHGRDLVLRADAVALDEDVERSVKMLRDYLDTH